MVPFSFAGLLVDNSDLDITSCRIFTAVAQEPMQQLHDRQASFNQSVDYLTPRIYIQPHG
jgi:putative SOS response-associated peptidase YedK